jgi:hypothetical protein
MEKKIQDYLPFYIGCEVYFIDEQNKVKYYGDFEGAVITGIFQCPSGAGLMAQLMVDDWEEPLDVLVSEIKPLLRRLSDMTEEEKDYALKIGNSYPDSWVGGANRTAWLLSKHFDLFGLIEAGLALDKSKIISPNTK